MGTGFHAAGAPQVVRFLPPSMICRRNGPVSAADATSLLEPLTFQLLEGLAVAHIQKKCENQQ
jgi:hypothetical protein